MERVVETGDVVEAPRAPRRDAFGAVRLGHRKGVRKTSSPVGTIVVRVEHVGDRKLRVRYIKVRLDGPPQHRWMAYARWWWIQNKGPIPAGKMVLHLDGVTSNDAPENLVLGGHGDRVALWHLNNPEASTEQHRRAGAATGEHNRFAGKLHRLREVLPGWWYPVWDREGIVFNVPFRRRPKLFAWFGADVAAWPSNGRAAKLIARLDAPVRAARGRELEAGILGSYLRIDPEFGVGAGRRRQAGISKADEARLEQLQHDPIYKRAAEAAALDLKARK